MKRLAVMLAAALAGVWVASCESASPSDEDAPPAPTEAVLREDTCQAPPSVETFFDVAGQYKSADGNQVSPAVAFDQLAVPVAVWTDFRTFPSEGIFASRLGLADGSSLDLFDVPIETKVPASSPRIAAWGASGHVAVWEQDEGGVTVIRGATLDLSLPGSMSYFTVPFAEGAAQRAPDVVAQEAELFVVWEEAGAIYGAVGEAANLSLLQVHEPTVSETIARHPAIVSIGEQYFIVWEEDPGNGEAGILGARVRSSGAIDDLPPISPADGFSDRAPRIVAVGTDPWVAWEIERTAKANVAISPVVSPSMDELECNDCVDRRAPAADACGDAILIAWEENDQVFGARVPAGNVAAQVIAPMWSGAQLQYDPAVACDDAGALVVVSQAVATGDDSDIVAGTWPFNADPIDSWIAVDPTPVSTQAREQLLPAASFGAGRHFVAWMDEEREGQGYVAHASFESLNAEGVAPELEGSGIAIVAGSTAPPAVGSGELGTLLAWEDADAGNGPELAATWLEEGGGGGFEIAGAMQPSVAYDSAGDRYLLAWRKPLGTRVHARLLAAGEKTGTEYQWETNPNSDGDSDVRSPAVAAHDGSFFIAFPHYEDRGAAAGEADLLLSRIDADSPSSPPTQRMQRAGTQVSPALASDGQRLLLAWANVGDDGRTIQTLLLPNGVELAQDWAEQVEVLSKVASGRVPQVAPGFDGNNFLVAWEGTVATSKSAIFGSWIRGSTGEVLDPGGILLLDHLDEQTAPALSAGPGTGVVLSYQRIFEPDGGSYGSSRVRSVALSSGMPNGCACTIETASECSSRICEDGVCCIEVCGDCEVCGTDGQCVFDEGAVCPGNFTCVPQSGPCVTNCDDSTHCAKGFQCHVGKEGKNTCEPADALPAVGSCGLRQGRAEPRPVRALIILALALLAARRVRPQRRGRLTSYLSSLMSRLRREIPSCLAALL